MLMGGSRSSSAKELRGVLPYAKNQHGGRWPDLGKTRQIPARRASERAIDQGVGFASSLRCSRQEESGGDGGAAQRLLQHPRRAVPVPDDGERDRPHERRAPELDAEGAHRRGTLPAGQRGRRRGGTSCPVISRHAPQAN
ncbi:hypothetical protein BRADI_5g26962v3 [Brachypodium distachyon]|uniref:Uncharacterized protein n=1 Tax=Brachypodium distachyon TaxID=15368 RepID=A0A2K2CJJ1_BRADI|nr:hypothetical protein BRADI_5g26962v3 [Brachypodium distachyon]